MAGFGYFNKLGGRKMMFATEEEYYEMLREAESENDADANADADS